MEGCTIEVQGGEITSTDRGFVWSCVVEGGIGRKKEGGQRSVVDCIISLFFVQKFS